MAGAMGLGHGAARERKHRGPSRTTSGHFRCGLLAQRPGAPTSMGKGRLS
ncbi:Hypothetical Protein RSKD131_1910 [Cereibacter sphaeroides KD131]|nr:Hypothetical Protein RSKD131_1910 [Cereibacter sphaeroides KD131]